MRVKGLLSGFCPVIEDYSIDESFLDFRGFDKFNLRECCEKIARTVKQGTGIPVSIGIAPTKTLAKVANKYAKKYAGYQSVCLIDTEEKRVKALKNIEICDVWGIGRRHTKRLTAIGIKTAYDFTQLHRVWVRNTMTVTGERTWSELRGTPCIKMEPITPPKKSIMISRSFGKMTDDYNVLCEAISTFTAMAAAKLRKQKSCAKSILIFIDTNPYREDLSQYSQNIVINLPVATNSTHEMMTYVLSGLKKIFRPNFMYKKAGVLLMDICSQDIVQGNLFDTVNRKKQQNLMDAMDCINDRYGRNSLRIACMGNGKEWKIKQERLSPCYTTRLTDLPKIS
jgi:DNA polymerase V